MTRIVEPPVPSPSSSRDDRGGGALPAREAALEFGSSSGGAAPRAGMPLGYVVASGVLLAIAVVGFGLWLAFEVIAL